MAEQDKLCYSPNGGSLAYHSTDDNLIYKGTATPPTPPTEYGDAIVIATVSPTYIQGDDISGTGADYRLHVSLFPGSTAFATCTTTVTAPMFRDDTETVLVSIAPYWGLYYDHDAPITVDIAVIQPSSGYIYTTTVQGSLHQTSGQPIHSQWSITITGDPLSRITSILIVPAW